MNFSIHFLFYFITEMLLSDIVDEKDLTDIDEITFGIYSPEEIKRNAVCEVNNPKLYSADKKSITGSVYDTRMGITQNNVKCPTCGLGVWGCPGHPGYIQLNEALIHPLFYKQVIYFLQCCCIHCNALFVSEDQLALDGLLKYKGVRRLKKIIEKIDKIDICNKCGKARPEIKYAPVDNSISLYYKKKDAQPISIILSVDDIKKVFDDISEDDVRLLGFDPALIQPRNLILTIFPVISIACRPYVISEGNMSDDDLSIQLTEIIKVNNQLAELENKPSEETKRQKFIQILKSRISAFYNNSGTKLQMTNGGRPMNGLKQRLTGKSGLIRNSLLAKRCEQTARTVIGPEPTLKVGQVGIPKAIADVLTIPVQVNANNIEYMQYLVDQGRVSNVLINKGQAVIVLSHATQKRGTRLNHGDKILRKGKEIEVLDTRVLLEPGDKVSRNGTLIDVSYPSKKRYEVKIGDICDRYLTNGDIVLLNRQPTLHSAGMLGMEVVLTNNKNIQFNLSITKGFNVSITQFK